MKAQYTGKKHEEYSDAEGQAVFAGSGWLFIPAKRAEGDTRRYPEFAVRQSELKFLTPDSEFYRHDLDSPQGL